jgi:hypothetical protein
MMELMQLVQSSEALVLSSQACHGTELRVRMHSFSYMVCAGYVMVCAGYVTKPM